MAVLSAIVGFCHTMVGFTNHQLVERINALLDDVTYASRQATYDLRRLIRKRMITRIPHTQRYQLTTRGRAIATLFSKAHGRVLTPALASMTPTLAPDIAARSPLTVPGEPSTGPWTPSSPTRCSPPHHPGRSFQARQHGDDPNEQAPQFRARGAAPHSPSPATPTRHNPP
jgi:hypothetical protein